MTVMWAKTTWQHSDPASEERRTEQGPLEQRKPERANTENNASNICASLTATHVVADNEGAM